MLIAGSLDMRRTTARHALAIGRGFTLIEILVTIVILAFGLLGVASMQVRASKVEFESYQRGQALTLVRDMESHLRSSRSTVPGYLDALVSSTDGSLFFGVGGTDYTTAGSCTSGATPVEAAKYIACSWGRTLQGVADGSTVGAMAGARGCLMRVEPANASALADVYIVVVWQGADPTSEPPAASPAGQCASTVDFGAGRKRGVSMRVLIPDLQQGV